MPPNPPPFEAGIPGSTIEFSSSAQLYTHSSKFPIERQITLSTTEKNFKIPILNDIKKRSKGAVIAPDAPPKRLAAWIHQDQMQPHQIYSEQSLAVQQQQDGLLYRASYCPEVEIYGGNNQIKPSEEEQEDKTMKSKGVAKTYHTLKDILSAKFRKEPEKESEAASLNNVPVVVPKKPEKEPDQTQLGCGQVYPQPEQHHQYNQQFMHQQQFYAQQLRNQQQYSHLIQSRPQDPLKHRADDQCQIYGQKAFMYTQQQPNYGNSSQEHQILNRPDYHSPTGGVERRSAQQIERDNILKQKTLEARRTLSHPHLLLDNEPDIQNSPKPQPTNMRRGSLGNILEANHTMNKHEDKESDDGGFLNRNPPSKSKYSEVQEKTKVADEGRRHRQDTDGGEKASNIDSGRGSAAYSSGRRPQLDDIADTAGNSPRNYHDNDQDDSEWVDIVEKELRHILEPKLLELSLKGRTRSTVSGSISSITPPLPPLSGDNLSPTMTPRPETKFKGKSAYDQYKGKSSHSRDMYQDDIKSKYPKKFDYNMVLRGKQIFGLDSTDLTSTTTRSLESILDAQSDSDANLSATDTKAIRKQLEGLENMYSEVLKFLGVNRTGQRYQPSDPRIHKKRHGSMSSLPSSSVSSVRRDRRRGIPDDRRRIREPRTNARRFQRLESHVVTLARSVAHLSSEMRTQHMVVQEIESVRQEVAALRAQTNMLNIRSHSTTRTVATNSELPTLANPTRVKKLTKFFGDEPPLLRLFLRKLGYEKYANVFENEKIGMVELPYLSEERLQKIGVPLGPRLRIMQEAQISVCDDNTLCIV